MNSSRLLSSISVNALTTRTLLHTVGYDISKIRDGDEKSVTFFTANRLHILRTSVFLARQTMGGNSEIVDVAKQLCAGPTLPSATSAFWKNI